jgi:hypothetical protein
MSTTSQRAGSQKCLRARLTDGELLRADALLVDGHVQPFGEHGVEPNRDRQVERRFVEPKVDQRLARKKSLEAVAATIDGGRRLGLRGRKTAHGLLRAPEVEQATVMLDFAARQLFHEVDALGLLPGA